MQKHLTSSEEPTISEFIPTSNPMVQARIDAYLDRTCAPLFVSLPQNEALQQRAEMQSHLESLVTAHIALGFSETEAVTLALEQFGKEQSVAKAWKQECAETNVERGNGTILSALRPVVGYSVLSWIVFLLSHEVYIYLFNDPTRVGVRTSELLMWLVFTLYVAQQTLFPVFLGFLAGRRTRGRTLAITLMALPFTITLCESIVYKVYNSFYLILQPFGWHQALPSIIALIPLVSYLKFGALGAGAALLLRRKTLRMAGNR